MHSEQEISFLTQKIQQDPLDQDSRNRLGLLLLPTILGHWPATDRTDNIEAILQFYDSYIKPLSELLKGVCSIEVADFLFKVAGLMHWAGDNDTSLQYAKEAIELNSRITSQHKLGHTNIRFFQLRTGIQTQFGHLIHEPDCYVRRVELGWQEELRPLLILPDRRCANKTLLSYWQKYLCVVSNPYLCQKLGRLSRELEYNSYWLEVPKVGIRYGHSGVIACINKWEDEGRPPVLHLKKYQIERGRELLAELGIPRDAWFAAAHVRNSEVNQADVCSPRNSNLDSYQKAYEAITKNGGYVLRLGTHRMPKLPKLAKVVDLAALPQLPDWFDIFAISQCRFFLGSASGPGSLAASFATPHVMTNIPANCFAVSEKDIFLPKLLRNKTTKQLFKFKDLFTPKFQYIFNPGIYEKLGVEVVDNEPDDLESATIEMIERLNRTATYEAEDIHLLRRFEAIASSLEGRPLKCRLARDFARKHRDLILG
jgi:putative glycosyltransferase (TIGR04372 family)